MENLTIEKKENSIRLDFKESLTVMQVKELKDITGELIKSSRINQDKFIISFSLVQEIDSAGFQLIYIILKELRKRGLEYEIEGFSERFGNIFKAYNVEI